MTNLSLDKTREVFLLIGKVIAMLKLARSSASGMKSCLIQTNRQQGEKFPPVYTEKINFVDPWNSFVVPVISSIDSVDIAAKSAGQNLFLELRDELGLTTSATVAQAIDALKTSMTNTGAYVTASGGIHNYRYQDYFGEFFVQNMPTSGSTVMDDNWISPAYVDI